MRLKTLIKKMYLFLHQNFIADAQKFSHSRVASES